jgi:hypothetical protein
MNIECDFDDPVKADGTPAGNTNQWNFKYATCVMPDFPTSTPTSSLPVYISQVISTSSPANNFYISKTIDLGQILILGLFILAFVFAITISIKNLIFSQKIKF